MNFDLNNYEDHILDFLEGQLSDSEIDAYQNWKAANPQLQAEEDLMRQTFLTPEPMSYSNKEALKSFGKSDRPSAAPVKVVPLYRKFWSLGIAAAAVLGIFFWMNMNDAKIAPGKAPIVEAPVITPSSAHKIVLDQAQDNIQEVEEAQEISEVKEQGMFAGINSMTNKAKEIVASNDSESTKKKPRNKRGATKTKRPERFTKEDINLDRRYNNAIAKVEEEKTIIKKPTPAPAPAPAPVINKALAEQVAAPTDFETPSSNEDSIMEEVIVAEKETARDQENPALSPAKEVETKEIVAELALPEVKNENDKVLYGWQKVRASIQDKNSVLGYAAREAADFVTPTILEKESNRKKRSINVNIDIARTNLGKTIKKLRNK